MSVDTINFIIEDASEEQIDKHKKDIAEGYFPGYIEWVTKIVEGTPHAKHLPEILAKIVYPYSLENSEIVFDLTINPKRFFTKESNEVCIMNIGIKQV